MNLSLQLLKTSNDCNTLLAIAAKEKEDLEFRKSSLQRHRKVSTNGVSAIDIALQTVISQITNSQAIIATLPDGDDKEEESIKLMDFQSRKAKLERRKKNKGVIDVLETEFEIDRVEKEIVSTDEFIQNVTNRLNEL